jgi:carbamoyltransferase
MDIVGLNRHHNGATTLLRDGEVVFHVEEERITRQKHAHTPYLSLLETLGHSKKIDALVMCGMADLPKVEHHSLDFYTTILSKHYPDSFTWYDWNHNHHELHAAHAFYNSGFDNAVCVVADGAGSFFDGKQEMESIYTATYPAKFDCVHKKLSHSGAVSVGWMFEAIARYLGFDGHDAGKVMGLASYGHPNSKIPDLTDPSLFDCEWHDNITFTPQGFNSNFQTRADLAYALQKVTQERVLELIKFAVKETGNNNVCLSGGYALNCVANYYYLKNLPKEVNLYVEPAAHDAGTSIGAAKKLWHQTTGDTTVRKQKHIYLGPKPTTYDIPLLPGEHLINAYDYNVIDLIIEGKAVALFQGGSEAGPRALGNRTILFDPRNPKAKDIVNQIKKRETFRPFAGTVLQQEAANWFDMCGLEESPFMMYAMDVLPEVRNKIPGVVHVDGTCRVQTITKDQNLHFYNLVESFGVRTGVPILFNTSFNLAGEPLVETVADAVAAVRNSDLNFLYMPEVGKLFVKDPNGQEFR